MNVMIVDDQQVVVSGIYFNVKWKALGIDNVYPATSAAEAKSIFSSHVIDILLCDIDMPGENGLSLFQWVKEKGYETACIFLTSHDNFNYVKQAFLIGALNYILQPARYEEIEQVISEAILHIQSQKEQNQFKSYGKLFFSEIATIQQNIMGRLYRGEITFSDFVQKLCKAEIDLSGCHSFAILLTEIIHISGEAADIHQYISKYVQDYLFLSSYRIVSSDISPTVRFNILYSTTDASLTEEPLNRCLSGVSERLTELFNTQVAFFAAFADDKNFSSNLCILKQAVDDNVSLKSGILFKDSISPVKEKKVISGINPKRLKDLLLTQSYEEFSQLCRNYLQQHIQANQLDRTALNIFHITVLQTFYKVIDTLSISLSDLISNVTDWDYINQSPKNIQEAYQFIDFIVDTLSINQSAALKTDRHINRIIEYIHTHIDDDLKRNDIAAAVFLTPDYITKIFKEQMHLSLKEYILQEKINIARDRLRTTDMSINEIATLGGFTNFSHFSQVYKKYTGNSPNKERKQTSP